MKKAFIISIICFAVGMPSYGATIKNIPFESTYHMGLASGIGMGVDFGIGLIYPAPGLDIGFEVEILVTNVNYEQNVNTTKLGLFHKFDIMPQLYAEIHGGTSSFYVAKAITYNDVFSGKQYTIPADTDGRCLYYGVSLNYMFGEYIISPKISFNNISGGGTVSQLDINVGHKI